MISFIEKGDIFAIKDVYNYAHGCNCAGAMGKGIVLQFRKKFPEMYLIYKTMCKEGKFNPGDIFDYDYGEGHIYNLGTQKTWKTAAKIEYIQESLFKMLEIASLNKIETIALPAIGAGLGGLEWNDVKELMKKLSSDFPEVHLIVVESYSA